MSCVSHDGCSDVGARDAVAGPAHQPGAGPAKLGRKTRWADQRGLLTCGLASPAGLRLLDARRSHASASPRLAVLLLLFPTARHSSLSTGQADGRVQTKKKKRNRQHRSKKNKIKKATPQQLRANWKPVPASRPLNKISQIPNSASESDNCHRPRLLDCF